MEFSMDPGQASYRITACDQNAVVINGQRYTDPIVVLPEHLITPWQVEPLESMDSLEPHHFDTILTFKPKIILLGTGQTLRFPKQALYQYLAKQGIGLEAMTTLAACRTYAVLMAEERSVAAALFIK